MNCTKKPAEETITYLSELLSGVAFEFTSSAMDECGPCMRISLHDQKKEPENIVDYVELTTGQTYRSDGDVNVKLLDGAFVENWKD